MKKLLNNPWLVAALVVGALAMASHSFWPWLSGPAEVAEVSPPEASAETNLDEGAGKVVISRPSAEPAPAGSKPSLGLRDPFASVAKHVAKPVGDEGPALPDERDTVHLSAIWTQDGTTYVVLNGRICRPGDAIGKLKVEAATQDGVWLGHWRGRDFLALGSDFTLTTPSKKPMAGSASL